MAIKVKSNGAYADIVGVFHKRAGAYEAVQGIYAKAGGVYGRVDAAAVSESYALPGIVTHNNQPRSLSVDGWLYTGAVGTSTSGIGGGDVAVAEISPAGIRSVFPLRTNFGVNDHLSPSLFRLTSGRVIAFYSDHGAGGPTRYRVSSDAAPGIAGFLAEKTIAPTSPFTANSYIFAICKLSDGNVRIFRRLQGGGAYQVEMLTASEAAIEAGTETWTAQNLIVPPGTTSRRPYPFFCATSDRIDVFTSRGNPGDGSLTGSIFHFYMQLDGGVLKVYNSAGTEVVGGLPIDLDASATLIKDESGGLNWPYQIAYGSDSQPRVLWFVNTAGTLGTPTGQYWFGRWTGSVWDTFALSTGNYPNYAAFNSSGICFDGNDTSKVYIAESKTSATESALTRYTVDTVGKVLTGGVEVATGSGEFVYKPFSPTGYSGNQHAVQFSRGTFTSFTDYDMDAKTMGLAYVTAPAPASYAAETTAFLARLTTQPNATQKDQIDRFISRLVADGIWAKLDVLYVNAAFSEEASLLNAVAATFPLSKVGSPTFSAGNGWTGLGTSTDYLLMTGGSPSALTKFVQNSASMGAMVKSMPASPTGNAIGRVSGSAQVLINLPGVFVRLNSSSSNEGSTGTRTRLMIAGNRSTSTTQVAQLDGGVFNSITATSAAKQTEAITLLRSAAHTQMLTWFGSSLTEAEHNAIASAAFEYAGWF